jgi:hypothetical protein
MKQKILIKVHQDFKKEREREDFRIILHIRHINVKQVMMR